MTPINNSPLAALGLLAASRLLAASGMLAASALIIAAGGERSVSATAGQPARVQSNDQVNADHTAGKVERRDLVLTRVFDAPVEQVWKAWTNPEYVMRWWGPRGFTSPSCKIDFREGGKFVFCMRAPKEMGGQDLYTAGVYKKIVPLQLIEFSQGLSDKDGNSIDPTSIGMPPDFPKEIPSALAFRRVGQRTELTATEYGWAVGQMRDMSESGLSECLDKLAEVLARP
jgi:uncharacterized protein YndB with AHSA1/START domain